MSGEWARTTEGGKLVYLLENGTWQFSEGESPPVAPTSGLAEPQAPPPPPAGEPQFRRSYWGDRRDSVRSLEGSEPEHEGESSVVFAQKLSGLDVLVVYVFVDDQLVRGKYVVTQEHSSPASYLVDRVTLLALLRKKYGEPSSEDLHWNNDLYRDEPSEWGDAVAAGHLSIFTSWSDEATDLILALTGDNYEVNLEIEYNSTVLGELETQRDERAALDDL